MKNSIRTTTSALVLLFAFTLTGCSTPTTLPTESTTPPIEQGIDLAQDIPVPDFTKLNVLAAQIIMERENLIPEYTGDITEGVWIVTAQEPLAGTMVQPGSTIKLTLVQQQIATSSDDPSKTAPPLVLPEAP